MKTDDKKSSRIQSPEVVVVEASAGSGKTYALAKRYLQLLINPNLKPGQIPLRSILAITFTNKATIEMKERILELLKRIAFDDFKEHEKDIYSAFDMTKEAVRAKAGLIMDEIIRRYNYFQVQTIDSFINALLLGCSMRIDRSSSFQIKSDYSQHLDYCLDLVIEQSAADKKIYNLLKEFLEHYLYVENKTGWFPRDAILDLMSALYKQSNKYGRFFRQDFNGLSNDDIFSIKNAVLGLIKEMAGNFPEGLNKTASNQITKFAAGDNRYFAIKELPGKFKDVSVPMNKDFICPPEYEKKWRAVHHAVKKLVNLESAVYYKPYLQLYNRLLDNIRQVARKEDILFLEELNRAARLVTAEIGVPELYYRLAGRFRHYLIDEFQDTSYLQWSNLEMMAEEALSTGGSLFYVGDKKQAIYRFRGGESTLFDEVKKRFEQFNVRPQKLNTNWRSQKAIVDFNNRVFSRANLETALFESGMAQELAGDETAVEEILGVYKDAEQQHKDQNPDGYVRVERIAGKHQDERNKIIQPKIIGLVRELNLRFGYKNIAVLCREKDEVELVTSWLLEQKIPVETEKTLNVMGNPLAKEIIGLLNFLHSPVDDLSFSAFILGEIFAASSGLSQSEIRDFIFGLNKTNARNEQANLYNIFRRKYPRIWEEYIEELFRNVGFVPPYELLISIYRKFGVMAKFKGYQAFFMKLLELVKSAEDEYTSLGEFLDYLKTAPPDDLYVRTADSDSVKILTVHKAKGLEFPVVVIPFLRMDISPETGGARTASHLRDETAPELELIKITKEYREYSEELQKIYTRDYKKSCIDELNNIYVALTRPRCELYIFIPEKSGASVNKAGFVIPADIKEVGRTKTYPDVKQSSGRRPVPIPVSEYQDWIGLFRDEFGGVSAIRDRDGVLDGNIMHAMLSEAGNCQGTEPDAITKRIIKTIAASYPFISDFSGYERKLRLILDNAELKEFFFVPDGEVLCEKEISNRFGDTRRIDRLIITGREARVIDYKSAPDKAGADRQQVLEYMAIIGEIYPKLRVKGYLIHLDKITVSEVI
ncbi:MAG: UvrD-helicase domain-containing protein [Planctomycetota bacterium]